MDLNFSGNMFEYMSELIFKSPFHIHAHMKNIYNIYIFLWGKVGEIVFSKSKKVLSEEDKLSDILLFALFTFMYISKLSFFPIKDHCYIPKK